MNKKQKKAARNIIIAIVLVVSIKLILSVDIIPSEFADKKVSLLNKTFKMKYVLEFVLFMIPYFVVGWDILRKAFKGILNKQVFDENFLMAVATIGAIIMGEYVEGVAVMLFYQIGELFQSVAVGKSRKNISDLMEIRPDYANLEVDENGETEKVDPDEVEVGSIIVVYPGEKIPIDGVVISGNSTLNTAALTGESVPRTVNSGDEVISGCVNMSGILRIETTKEFDESTASKILELVENASSRKSTPENFITKFAKVYTPLVCYLALALAVIPPVLLTITGHDANVTTWIYRALTFLVISCPCALVISIPLTFFAGLGGASHEGILIKGSNYMENLSKVSTVVFDKTGTMTKGVFEVTQIIPANGCDENILLRIAAIAESVSNHPIARSIVNGYLSKEKGADLDSGLDKESFEEVSGKGIKCSINSQKVLCGNEKLMDMENVAFEKCDKSGSIVYVAIDGVYKGCIVISDEIKETAKEALKKLRDIGIKENIMLTGDVEAVAKDVSKQIGANKYYANLLPQNKVEIVEELLTNMKDDGKLIFVGDGINDAPVLSRADIGVAMGALGQDAAIEAADVVLMNDDPLMIQRSIKIARKCIRIVYENIYFAIGVKVLCLILGALGIANMWLAIFADVGVMVLAVLNAIRALRTN